MGGSTVSALIEGDDLRLVRVGGGGMGLRAEPLGVAESPLSRGGSDALRGMLRSSGASRLVLTVPGDWAAVRPVAMGRAQWRDGAGEVRRSVGSLLPLSPDDAMLGLIESAGAASGGGYLVGVSASQARPWIELIERAAGRRVDAVLTPHMAMLGLGLQEFDQADVIEPAGAGGWGGWVRHRLSEGLVERLGESWSAGDPLAGHAVAIGGDPGVAGVRAISGDELAVGAALASRVAGDSFVALDASPAPSLGRWVLPVGGLAAAIVLLVAGSAWHQSRLERASERIDARIAQIGAQVEQTTALRDEAQATMAMIESARREASAADRKMLPHLVSALSSIPEGGFLWSLEITPDRLLMQGEAPRSGEVVQRLELSDEFESAKLVSPVSRSQGGRETFDVTAQRSGAGGGRGGR